MLITPTTPTIQLHDHLDFPPSGVLNKIIWKDSHCQYSLLRLAAGAEISEHTSSCNATVHVIAGSGTLTLQGQSMDLEPNTFIFMAANAPHALTATTNLAFVLTLSSES